MVEAATKAKIEAHIRKHRASGGKASAHEQHDKGKGAESADRGTDDAEEDLKDKPADRSAPNNVGKESGEMKAKKGGRVKHRKEGGKCEGMEAHHHAGRKRRASGGAAENSPFTTALKSTQPKGRSTEKETQGYDH